MIIVGERFNAASVRRYGLEQSIDDDRKAVLFEDDRGCYMLILVNGQRQHRVAFGRDVAEAVFELLGTALSEGLPDEASVEGGR